jgi:hypothetical protein
MACNRLDRGFALRAHHHAQHSRMIPSRADAAADAIGQSFGSANVVEQARRKSSAESFAEYRGRKVIRIAARDSQRYQLNLL